MAVVLIDTRKIIGWASFHQVFKDAIGFPEFYGMNMNAWIDCLSDLHEDFGLCQIKLIEHELLHLHILDTTSFNKRLPEIVDELIECAAFVNARSTAAEENPKLSLVFLDGN